MNARASLWSVPIRLASILSVAAYLRTAYRIRRWGRLPYRRGATLVVANHQHDLDDMALVAHLTLDGPLCDPVCTVSSRRLFEPGFLATRLPLFEPWLRHYNPAPLFAMIGMQPIENQLATRPIANLAGMLYERYGDFALKDVFGEAMVQRLGLENVRASEVGSARWFRCLQAHAKLMELREPFRSEAVNAMRVQVERDLSHIEELLKRGATFYLAPEGRHTTDGRMLRFRGAFARMAPHAQIYVAPISYDPFAAGRFSMLYRILRCDDRAQVELLLRAQRPVTVSQLLAEWLLQRHAPFSEPEAVVALQSRLADFPTALFVDPELRTDASRRMWSALANMSRLELLQRVGSTYTLTGKRTHPEFPEVDDMLAYQTNFLRETLEAAAVIAHERGQT